MDLQKQISMCARHHAKWRRAASFARDTAQRKKYLERAVFWMEMQTDLVSVWSEEKKDPTPNTRRKLMETKSSISSRLASYGRNLADEF